MNETLAKRCFWLAFQAARAAGLGWLHATDASEATEDAVWSEVEKDDRGYYGDYIFGRMMKMQLPREGEVPSRTLQPDYQSWCGTYGTYAALIAAARETLLTVAEFLASFDTEESVANACRNRNILAVPEDCEKCAVAKLLLAVFPDIRSVYVDPTGKSPEVTCWRGTEATREPLPAPVASFATNFDGEKYGDLIDGDEWDTGD